MESVTRIITKNLANETLLIRTIEGWLYPAVIGQIIETQDTDGQNVTCTVIRISDSVYSDIIHRYVEVTVNKIIL